MKSLRSHFSTPMILLGVLCLAVLVFSPRAEAASPCCGIASIDAQTGLVTAFEPGNGLKFEFKVKSAKLLKTLKVGQAVNLNTRTKSVSVKGLPKDCCTLVKILASADKLGPGSIRPPGGGGAQPFTGSEGEAVAHCEQEAKKSENMSCRTVRDADTRDAAGNTIQNWHCECTGAGAGGGKSDTPTVKGMGGGGQ
jgi:hypothetical protein